MKGPELIPIGGGGDLRAGKIGANEEQAGEAFGYNDVVISLSRAQTVGQGVPGFGKIDGVSEAYAFEFTNEGNEANEKRLAWDGQVPHSVKTGPGGVSPLRFHVHFYTGARVPLVDEVVRFEFNRTVVNIGEVLNTAVSTVSVVIPAGLPAHSHFLGPLVEVVKPDLVESADMRGLIRRKSSDALDTYEDSIWPLYNDPHMQLNKMGTSGV